MYLAYVLFFVYLIISDLRFIYISGVRYQQCSIYVEEKKNWTELILQLKFSGVFLCDKLVPMPMIKLPVNNKILSSEFNPRFLNSRTLLMCVNRTMTSMHLTASLVLTVFRFLKFSNSIL